MEVLKKVVERLEISNGKDEQKVKCYIEDITQKIKNVCNRTDLPKELEYLVIKYAENCYRYYKNIDNKEVSSVSDNGQTVNFKSIEYVKKEDVDLNTFIENNKDEIAQYSFARW